MPNDLTTRAASATPPRLAHRIRGLSDRTIAWIFVTALLVYFGILVAGQ